MQKSLCSKFPIHLLLTIALLSFLRAVSAQTGQAVIEDWRIQDFSFSARMMAPDGNDNTYVLGDTAVGDYLVVKKLSPGGGVLWQVTYDPAERLRGVWITVDHRNNPVVLASIITGSKADPAGWLTLKYDTNGALLWSDSLPGPFSDARRVAIDAKDNIYVAGRMWITNVTGNISLDSVLIKYSSGGQKLWTATFDNGNGTAVDEPYSLVISPDSTRIGVAGKSGNMFMGLMYDASGNLLWANTNANAYPANDVAFGLGNVTYFATGKYLLGNSNPYQMAIAKFDALGHQVWLKSYSVGDRTYRLKVDGQENVVATGIDVVGYMDWMTIKTDADGNLQWSQRYDGGKNNDEIPNMLMLDAFNAVYVTGTGGPNPSSGTVSYLKGVIVKYSSTGLPQWALWDPYANGKAMGLGAGNTLASLGFGYLVSAHYTETGVPDLTPAAPTDLSGSEGFTGSSYVVNLSFIDNANNEFWVEVERCAGSGCSNFSKVGQTLGENSSGFRDSNVARDTTYRYRARAVGFMGYSDYTNTVEVTLSPTNPPAAPPTAPSNLIGQPLNKSQISLSWTNTSTTQDGVKIEACRGSNCTDFIQIAIVEGAAATYTNSGLAANTMYRYRVRTYNASGNSDYSNIAAAKTLRK